MNLYVISGVTGMTGNEVARQLISRGDRVIGFDNFFASSIESIKDILNNPNFTFYEYDLNNGDEMNLLKDEVLSLKSSGEKKKIAYETFLLKVKNDLSARKFHKQRKKRCSLTKLRFLNWLNGVNFDI